MLSEFFFTFNCHLTNYLSKKHHLCACSISKSSYIDMDPVLHSMRRRPFLKWPPFWLWDKFRMSLYPKIFLVECSISVPNFMLVSSIAQFYQKFAHICLARRVGCGLETIWLHIGDDSHHYPDPRVRSESRSGSGANLHCKKIIQQILLCWYSAEVCALWVLLVSFCDSHLRLTSAWTIGHCSIICKTTIIILSYLFLGILGQSTSICHLLCSLFVITKIPHIPPNAKTTHFHFSTHIHAIYWQKNATKPLEKVALSNQEVSRIFRAPIYNTHRAVISATAQLSCTSGRDITPDGLVCCIVLL